MNEILSTRADNRQLEEALSAKVRQQAAVSSLGQLALTGIEMAGLMEEAAICAAQTLEVEYCKILELLPDDATFLMRAGVGWNESWVGQMTVKADIQTQAGFTLLSAEPVIVEDWETETRFEASELLRQHNVTSSVSVVIAGRDLPFGVLGAFTTRKRRYSEDEVYFLKSIANVLAAAIEQESTEIALRGSEQFNRAVLDSLAANIAILDKNGVIIAVNKGWETFARENGDPSLARTGVGVNYLDVCGRARGKSVDQAHQAQTNIQDVLNGVQATFSLEYACHAPAQKRWFLMYVTPLSGGEAGAVVSHLNITGRVQAERSVQRSNNILQTVIEGTADPIFVKDLQGRYIIANSAIARVMGKSVEEIIGKDDDALLTADLSQKLKAQDQQIIAQGQAATFEHNVTVAGDARVLQTTKSPYIGADGNIIGVIGVARDITSLRRDEHSHRVLAEASKILMSSLDYNARLTNVAHLAVPSLADWCSVDVLDEDETIKHVAVAHVDPEKVKWARELQRRYPPNWDAPTGVPNVLRTGASELYADVTDEILQAAARDAEHLKILRNLQLRSAMVVPLKARGRTLGAMTFVCAESGHRYDQSDLTRAEELAHHAAIAVDNARLYEFEQNTRQHAEQVAGRLASLQAITAACSRAVTPNQVAAVVMNQGLTEMGANSGLIALVDDGRVNLEVLYYLGYSADQVDAWRRFPLSAPVPLAETTRTGKPIFIESGDMLATHFPVLAQQRQTQHEALVSLPLGIEQQAIGVIGLSFVDAQTFSETDRAFMLALARQCSQALERARLYEAERQARAEAEAAQQHLALLAETRERNRLAQELHDNVAQVLGYLNISISTTHTMLSDGQIDTVITNLDELKRIINETYTDVREEIFNLRSRVSRGVGFLDTLRQYVEKYKRFYKLDVQLQFEADEALFDFPAEVGPQLIRVIQEALINVRKHAGVNKATIYLGEAADHLYIRIEDQGPGFEAGPSSGKYNSFGLQIMRERAESVDSELEIESEPGRGTRVTLRYPKQPC